MSDLMREFLEAYLKWAELNRAKTTRSNDFLPLPKGLIFDSHVGLCSNIHDYAKWKLPRATIVVRHKLSLRMRGELSSMLNASGRQSTYPFGRVEYTRRSDTGTHHRDPNRLAWIRSQLEVTQNV